MFFLYVLFSFNFLSLSCLTLFTGNTLTKNFITKIFIYFKYKKFIKHSWINIYFGI
jgi:hypothetical protein